MKALVLTLAIVLPLSGNPLEKHLWKNRLILVANEEQTEKLTSLLRLHQVELTERDLLVIDLSNGKHLSQKNHPALTAKEQAAVRKRFRLRDLKQPTFILIGKDGGEKARQKDRLDLTKFFALIDTMPMRKAEMKKQDDKKQSE